MDATKKPLRIPPEFARYAEEKEIFQLLEVTFATMKALFNHVHQYRSANATRAVGSETGRPAGVYDSIPEETRHKW